MKIKFISIIICALSLFLIGCSSSLTEPFNLVISNNSNEPIKSIGVYEKNSSNEITNVDNSCLKNNDNIKLMMENNRFTISIIDKNNNEFKSKEFYVDFHSNKDKIYNISIEKNLSNDFLFILK